MKREIIFRGKRWNKVRLLIPGMGVHWVAPISSEGGDGCNTWGNCHVWDNGEEEMTNILKMVNFKVHKFIVAYVKDILLRSIYSED